MKPLIITFALFTAACGSPATTTETSTPDPNRVATNLSTNPSPLHVTADNPNSVGVSFQYLGGNGNARVYSATPGQTTICLLHATISNPSSQTLMLSYSLQVDGYSFDDLADPRDSGAPAYLPTSVGPASTLDGLLAFVIPDAVVSVAPPGQCFDGGIVAVDVPGYDTTIASVR